ncbi:F-box only protein 9 [Trichuris trichiura]|uniref:F-box only protein 9 n=1 Tax=Trichuris trichiura TaxID=36087 RepID=A0A077Z5Z2_TRITR|nr:F-box only protein 9 [Trichuris trichiura]
MMRLIVLLCPLLNVDAFFWELDREDWRLNRKERLKQLAAPIDLQRPISHTVATTEPPNAIEIQLIEATTIAFGDAEMGSSNSFAMPAQVGRPRVHMIARRVFQGLSKADNRMIDVYTVRVRWLDPLEWNDERNDITTSGVVGKIDKLRFYDVRCWISYQGVQPRILVNRRVSAEFSGYGEKFQFPSNWDLTFQCAVRAINSLGTAGRWTAAEPVRVLRIPIYLPGLAGIDVRHLSKNEIINILSSAVRVSQGQVALKA